MTYVHGTDIENAKKGSMEGSIVGIHDCILKECPGANIVATFEDHVFLFDSDKKFRKANFIVNESGEYEFKSKRISNLVQTIEEDELVSHVSDGIKSLVEGILKGDDIDSDRVIELAALVDKEEIYWMSDINEQLEDVFKKDEWMKMYKANEEKIRTKMYGNVREIEGRIPSVYFSKISDKNIREFVGEIKESFSVISDVISNSGSICSGLEFENNSDFFSAVSKSLTVEAQAIVGLLGKAEKLITEDNMSVAAKAHDKMVSRARIMTLMSEYLKGHASTKRDKE